MLTIKNNKPFELNDKYDDIGMSNLLANIENHILTPLYTSHNGTAVQIQQDGKDVERDEICTHLSNVLSGKVYKQSEDFVKDLFEQTVLHYQKSPLSVDQSFIWTTACKNKLPAPSSNIIYTPASDIIEPAKEILAGIDSYDNLFVGIGFLFPIKSFTIAFKNQTVFNEFQQHLKTIMSQHGNLQLKTVNKLNQIATINLKLIEAIRIKNNYMEEDPEFDTVLNEAIQSFIATNQDCRLFPFSLQETIMPTVYTFIDVESHARETASTISQEYKNLKKLIDLNIKMISNKSIMSLSTIIKSNEKAQRQKNAHAKSKQELAKIVTKKMKFSQKSPKIGFYLKEIQRIIKKTGQVQLSHNVTKTRAISFQKPNRRRPDNIDAPGKITKTEYKPDLHIYLDTSGSINESNYEDAMKLCIMLAKKLNINLYFNSFSHRLSEESFINVKNKSITEIYNTFVKIPKVSGGTNYENIWNYINASTNRSKRVSLLITDFEYYAPNKQMKHPKNLYYMPCSNLNWIKVLDAAQNFAESMIYIDPTIRKKMLL